MTMHIKTPVTVLQELIMKRGWSPPEYNLVTETMGTTVNEFVYELEILHVIATGSGKSKKEAKHETARNMLKLLEEEQMYHPDNSTSILLPAPKIRKLELNEDNVEIVDYIRLLNEACEDFYMKSPQFELISALGPSHAKEFTFKCTLANHVTIATTGKKKTAKQEVAEKMWEIYKEVFEEARKHEVRPHLGVQMTEYNTALEVHWKDKGLTKDQLKELFSPPFNAENLTKALEELDLTYEIRPLLEDPESSKYVYICDVQCCISLASFGDGKCSEDAIKDAIENIYDTIYSYMEF